MSRRAASVASTVNSASEISAPVGLHGELIRMPRVRGPMASRIGPEAIANPLSGEVRTTTGVASASLTCSVNVGQYGAWVITSSPGLNKASDVLNSACFPPADAITSDSLYSTP